MAPMRGWASSLSNQLTCSVVLRLVCSKVRFDVHNSFGPRRVGTRVGSWNASMEERGGT